MRTLNSVGGLGVWGSGPPVGSGQRPGAGSEFLETFLNIGLKKIFQQLKIDTF